MIKTLGNSGYYRYELKAQTYYSLNYGERTLLLMWSSYAQHLVERYIDEIRSQIEMFTNHPLRQHCNNKQRQWIFERTNMEPVLKSYANEEVGQIQYTTLKRTHTTTKEGSTGMSTESLTNRTLQIYLWAQFMCVLLTPDTEIVSNRDVYGRHYISKLQKQKKKHIKKQKDLCSLQRLIEELKIENIKTNFRVSKGACYRFNSMSLM